MSIRYLGITRYVRLMDLLASVWLNDNCPEGSALGTLPEASTDLD
jgi:hypothetical protein